MHYHGLIDFPEVGDRRITTAGTVESALQAMKFTRATSMTQKEISELTLYVRASGKELDLSFTPEGIPIVTSACRNLLARMADDDVQMEEADVRGAKVRLWIVNVVARLSREESVDVDRRRPQLARLDSSLSTIAIHGDLLNQAVRTGLTGFRSFQLDDLSWNPFAALE